MSELTAEDVAVRGTATPDELAAVLAALQQRDRAAGPSRRFEQWRRQRRLVLRDNN
jgi:hypothetical protein